ncbi:hypothetical protein JX266_010854 [Neoarthrinium moseri]|nr:hypothetical protein JX266_010854 [Neoarthrinium moseri]
MSTAHDLSQKVCDSADGLGAISFTTARITIAITIMNCQAGRRRLLRVKPSFAHRGQISSPLSPFAVSSAPRQSSLCAKSSPASRVTCRYASSSAEARAKPEPQSEVVASRPVTAPLDATSQIPTPINPDIAISSTLNPPASTRPPPLDTPTREPDSSLFPYLLKLGKAYATFYKNGVKAILTNRRLLKEVSHSLNAPPHIKNPDTKVRPTRAAVLLRERTNHDLSRLPLFGLVVLICGEFTPLVVLAFPKMTPYTCRIPKQIEKLRTKAQERRAASQRNLGYVADSAALEKVTSGHIVRSLALGSSIWDKAGIDPPFAATRASNAIKRILQDDVMIRDGGGVDVLEPEEVVLACEDRAMDVRNANVDALRARLADWIQTTTQAEGDDGEAIVRKLFIGPRDKTD